MKTKVLLLAAAFIGLSTLHAQDVRFTQMHTNPLRLNPALMGANYDMSFNLGYRSQWTTVAGGYNTGQFTWMMPVLLQEKGHKLDVGVNVISDEYGAFTSFDGALSVSYSLKLSDNGHFLSAAIIGGFVQNTLDANNLTFDEQYQQGSFDEANMHSETLLKDQVGYMDAGMGVMWFYQPDEDSVKSINAFAGVSAYHINEPVASFNEGEDGLPRRITTLAGIKIYTNAKLDFSPQIRYDDQGGSQEFATGLYTGYAINSDFRASLGLWYRNTNAFAFILGFGWKDLKVGYSYDLPGADLSSGITNGSVNEISLTYKLPWGEKKGIKHKRGVMSF